MFLFINACRKFRWAVCIFFITISIIWYLKKYVVISTANGSSDVSDWPWDEVVRVRLAERNALLDEMCHAQGPFSKPTQVPWLRMQFGKGILACTIPKAGSTSIKAILGDFRESLSQNQITLRSKHSIRVFFLKNSPVRENLKEYMLKNSYYNLCRAKRLNVTSTDTRPCPKLPPLTSILNVRHPLDRIISAYNNKFGGGEEIRFGSNNCHNGLKRNHMIKKGDIIKVNFTEFLTHILSKANDHWAPYHKLCSPCHYKYDYIIQSETMDEDMHYILKKTGSITPSKKKTKHHNQSNSKKTFMDYFTNVTEDLVSKVMRKYEKDFLLFGYPIPDIVLISYDVASY